MTSPYCLRRATTSVLAAVALIGGAILFLGGRFNAGAGHALTQTVHAGAPVAACVAEENMRLITLGRERCRPDEIELGSGNASPGEPGLSGYEIVTARTPVAARETGLGEARCPAGKVTVGGGVLLDPESPERSVGQLEVPMSGPLLPGAGNAGHGWTATVRNSGSSPIGALVAAICVISR